MPQAENTSVTLNFTCYGGVSNPKSFITWLLDGDNITEQAEEHHLQGNYRADYVHSVLEMNATREINGQELTCIIVYGNRPVANDSVTLNMTCE